VPTSAEPETSWKSSDKNRSVMLELFTRTPSTAGEVVPIKLSGCAHRKPVKQTPPWQTEICGGFSLA